ncbi:MAG TPA: site-2 protease family protein [Legionellaceae bacterium]|nr:site-2 protease family protein [Legionellaceae bacterium]
MQPLSMIQTITIWIIPLLLAITLHEAAHAWLASLCGDTTAKRLGRLSMNPLNHIDPMGTIVVPIIMGLLSGFQFMFGWAKPVPIQWQHLRHPRRDMALVAFAGPAANLIMTFLWAICAKLALVWDPMHSKIALFMLGSGEAGIMINLVLALLNLLPIPPLDGSRMFTSILPYRVVKYYMLLEPFGFLIIIVLLVTGILGTLIHYPMIWLQYYIHILFHMTV